MIFAAGLGTRLRPFTNDKPKALVLLGGKTLLERAILKLKDIGVDRIVINVHHYADLIEEFLIANNNFGLDILISDEREELLNTGGGLKKASQFFIPNSPVLIYNVDVFSDLDLASFVDTHNRSNAMISMIVRKRVTQRYLCFNSGMRLSGWQNIATGEKKISRADFNESTNFAFSGIHLLCPEVFNNITEQGAFSIIDMYLRLARTEEIIGVIDKSEIWIDLGKPEQLKQAELLLNNIEEV